METLAGRRQSMRVQEPLRNVAKLQHGRMNGPASLVTSSMQAGTYSKMIGPRLSARMWGAAAAAYALCVLLVLNSWHIPLLADLERLAYDQRIAATAQLPVSPPVVQLVVFDEETLAEAPRRSPIDRHILAEALRRIDHMGPRAIGIDILCDRRTSPEEDNDLIATLRNMQTPTWLADSPAAAKHMLKDWQRAALEDFLSRVDPAGRHRANPLLFADADDVVRRSGPPEENGFGWVLAKAVGKPTASAEVPIDFRRAESPGGAAFEPLSIGTLVTATPEVLAALEPLIRGKIILIGGDLDNIDLHQTPLTAAASAGTSVRSGGAPGLEVHAQILTTLLEGERNGFLLALFVWALALVPPAIGVLIGWLRIPAAARVVIVLATTGFVLASSLLWESGPGVQTYGLPVIGAVVSWLLMTLVSGACSNAATNAERRLAREIGERYLPSAVARQIEQRPDLLNVHGQRTALAIVFTDLAGFTALSEELAAEALGHVLNEYLDGMTEVVLRHGGTLDKFIGDAVVCFWGAPLPDPQAARRALAAALDLQAFATRFRAVQAARGLAIGETRIGAHFGEAIVGNFGSRRRVQYTAIGDAMNLAARLESANKQLGTQIVASGELIAAANWSLARDLGKIVVKGRLEPCHVFQLDQSLTEARVAHHAALLARLRDGDTTAQSNFAAGMREAPEDLALAAFNMRAQAVGWCGTYHLETK